ncbi:MAG: GNAT family N-acetyltransferase [Halorubrum sp.]
MTVRIRPYRPSVDADGLYACKREFERGLGAGTGDEQKAVAYEDKLTDRYREAWLAWVDRCTEDDPRCVTVAVDTTEDGSTDTIDADCDDTVDTAADETGGDGVDVDGEVVGYVFVLPERLSFIWDAAVLNELYVAPEHRGTGVADDLVTAALDVAADQTLPLDRLVLDVDPTNQRARAFYERHGFENWGEMVARPVER